MVKNIPIYSYVFSFLGLDTLCLFKVPKFQVKDPSDIRVYLTRISIVCCMGRGPLLLMWLVVVSFVTFGPLACRMRVIMVFVRISLSTSS